MGLLSRFRGFFGRSLSPQQRTDRLLESVDKISRRNGGNRIDAWQNILTKVGTDRDKRTGGEFFVDPVTDVEARELWRGDDIAKRVIELLPRDGMKRGVNIKLDTKQQAEDLAAMMEGLNANRQFVRAGQFERAYGGAALFPVLNDSATNLSDQLNEDAITTISALHLFEPRQLRPVTYYEDHQNPKFGQVELWQLVPIGSRTGNAFAGTEIHESRMIIFPGIRVSIEQPMGAPLGFGDNVLTQMREVLRDYKLTWAAAVILLQDMAQGVFKMSGLADLVANDKDDEVVRRMMIVDMMRSVLRSMTIDKDDDFTRVQTPMTGMPEALNQFGIRLAASADMPVTKLMGQSPAGMNATGESDITIYDDSVMGWQGEHDPQMQQMLRFGILAKDGPIKGKEPKNWSHEWRPLRQMSEKEIAELRKIIAETDQINIGEGIYTSDDAAKSHYGGDTYSIDIVIDWPAREKQQKALEEAQASALEMQQQIAANANRAPADPNQPPADPAASRGATPPPAKEPAGAAP